MDNQLHRVRSPFAHTFSIVARDPATGEMGVAVHSHWFSVGSIVAWAEAGVGAIATQAVAEVRYGPIGLELMRNRKTAAETIKSLLAQDEGRDLRQLAVLDEHGNSAVHTGTRCIPEAGHEQGDEFSVQANMMVNRDVWPAMATAYKKAKGNLAERMLCSLEAGQAAGGDIRGQQSACILVVSGHRSRSPWEETIMDLRVEDHPEPITELRRLTTLHCAYREMNLGDQALGIGDVEKALVHYKAATGLAPQVLELSFWQAVSLADLGRMPEATPIFSKVFMQDPSWQILVQKLPSAGLLREDAKMMAEILSISCGQQKRKPPTRITKSVNRNSKPKKD